MTCDADGRPRVDDGRIVAFRNTTLLTEGAYEKYKMKES